MPRGMNCVSVFSYVHNTICPMYIELMFWQVAVFVMETSYFLESCFVVSFFHTKKDFNLPGLYTENPIRPHAVPFVRDYWMHFHLRHCCNFFCAKETPQGVLIVNAISGVRTFAYMCDNIRDMHFLLSIHCRAARRMSVGWLLQHSPSICRLWVTRPIEQYISCRPSWIPFRRFSS